MTLPWRRRIQYAPLVFPIALLTAYAVQTPEVAEQVENAVADESPAVDEATNTLENSDAVGAVVIP